MPSNSSSAVGIFDRLIYYYDLLKMYRKGASRINPAEYEKDYDELDRCARKLLGVQLSSAKVLEVGFGAKPHRIMYFSAKGIDIAGVDLDSPILSGSISEFVRVLRRNGILRASKSVVRTYLFDRKAKKENRELLNRVKGGPLPFYFDENRLLQGDASEDAFWDRISFKPDIVVSYRVFEHIPESDLTRLVASLSSRIASHSIVVVVITVWTGIIGGHLTDWYPGQWTAKRRSEPWEHLRKARYKADTFLNRMSRRSYRALFEKYFNVIEDRPISPDLGREFLNEEIIRELGTDEYELLSNDVLFVLSKKN